MMLSVYRCLTALSGPFLKVYLKKRHAAGKEHPTRHMERFGKPSQQRPDGKLLWIHSASNGEFTSVAPMIPLLLQQKPDWSILVTAGTRSASESFDRLAPSYPAGRVMHQFVPVDHPAWVESFMRHWQPDAALWMESELWPNLLRALHVRKVPVILLNARMRPKTVKRWRRMPSVAREMIAVFHTVFVMAENFRPIYQEFGARRIESFGNLKIDKPPLSVDPALLQELRDMIGDRPCIAAIATHPTDEALFADSYKRLKAERPGLLGIVALKHPARGEDVRQELAMLGLNVAVRGSGDRITPATDIYVANTIGEMGLWYTLCPFGLIGGSLFPFGGQNPYEGVHFGFVPIYGPHMFNFPDTTAILEENGISVPIQDRDGVYDVMKNLLDHPDMLQIKQAAARRVATESSNILVPTADYIVKTILSP